MRDLINQLGDYLARDPITAIPTIDVQPTMLNPRAWPPCKHCGGNVNCDNYDPDTQAPLWGATDKLQQINQSTRGRAV